MAASRKKSRKPVPATPEPPHRIPLIDAVERITGARAPLLLAIITIAVLLPFAGKAFHIDDPLFVWTARRIAARPADFWGFPVNWTGTPLPMWQITQNPPLASFYLALAGIAAGFGSIPLHLAMIIPAAAAIVGSFFLARRLSGHPTCAALLTLASPAFLVSATTVMSDVLMLALFVWAIVAWIAGIDEERRGRLLAASFLVVLATLSKYFALALIPLLAAYALYRRRPLGAWLPFFAIPAVLLPGYDLWTRHLYGEGHLTEAALFANVAKTQAGASPLLKATLGLGFTGGCAVAGLFFLPMMWKRSSVAGFAVFGAVVALVVSGLPEWGAYRLPATAWPLVVQLALFSTAGLSLLAAAAAPLRRRDAGALLLALAAGGTFVFATFVNWTLNARSILPLVPFAAIAVVRRLEAHPVRISAGAVGAAFALTALVSIAVTWSDLRMANSARAAAQQITTRWDRVGGRHFFLGHWGFQYEMEQRGWSALDGRHPSVKSEDLMVIPSNNSGTMPMPEGRADLLQRLSMPGGRWIATMSPAVGAGFYADAWGPLPWAAGTVPPDEYEVWKLR